MGDYYVKITIGDNTMFTINVDGTYVLNTPINITESDSEITSQENSCLLQCYSNGCINKISLSEIMQLRKNYTYSHGIFPGASIQYCDICSNNDLVIVLFEKLEKKYLSIKSVASLTPHTMLGLKGDNIIKTTYDKILKWYIVPNEQKHSIAKLIDASLHKGYILADNQEYTNEILWLNNNIKLEEDNTHLEHTTIRPIEDDIEEDFDFSSLIGIDKQESLREKFSAYLKIGSHIPIGQSHVEDVLSLCKTKDDFWRVILCLLECNMIIYRSPIVSYFKNNASQLFAPDYEVLNSIIKLIFSTEEKIEKNLEFLYPFRNLLTNEDIEIVRYRITEFSNPEHIHIYGAILNYDYNDLIYFCLDNDSGASYYCIYEILQKIHSKEGISNVIKMLDSIEDKIDGSKIEGKLIKNLIYNEFKNSRNYSYPDIIKIKAGGFTEFSKICHSYEGKKKHKNALNNITSLVSKRLDAKYVASYQNHYFLMTNPGIRVLLPKSMCVEKLSENCVANVYIVFADKANSTLYATQKLPADYKKIIQTPLLNNGDIIEVTFDLNGYPIPHKCYKKIKISIDDNHKNIDYHARYKAKVIRQINDKYHYLVKLI